MAAAVVQLGLVVGRFALGVTVTGLLALGAVAAGAAVVGRALLVSELILLTTVNAIVVADRRGRVVAVNRAFEEMTGVRAGTWWVGLWPPLARGGKPVRPGGGRDLP